MAKLLAIISKSVFEQMTKGQKPAPGAVLQTDRYTSNNARLDLLKKGGTLFLVTVRPPDEALWLVGELVEPKHKAGAWVSAPNALPITDISALKSQLKFDTGAGIQAKPGALGMSLQTPRVLTDGDVALLRAAASPKGGASAAQGEQGKNKSKPSGSGVSGPEAEGSLLQRFDGLAGWFELNRWVGLSPERQQRMLRWVSRAPGVEGHFVPLRLAYGASRTVGRWLHWASGQVFHLVPGALATVGLEPGLVTPSGSMAQEALAARSVGVQKVLVRPMLVAAAPWTAKTLTRLRQRKALEPLNLAKRMAELQALRGLAGFDSLRAQTPGKLSLNELHDLDRALAAWSLRLPTEVEWEHFTAQHLAAPQRLPAAPDRVGFAWGLEGLGQSAELCADSFEETFVRRGSEAVHNATGRRAVRGGAVLGTAPETVYLRESPETWEHWKRRATSLRQAADEVPENLSLRPVLAL